MKPPDRKADQKRNTKSKTMRAVTDQHGKQRHLKKSTCSKNHLPSAVWSCVCLLLGVAKFSATLAIAVASAAHLDETTSFPLHPQQIFHQESGSAGILGKEIGNPNQADNSARQQQQLLLSLRALPISSRGALAFVPRAQGAFLSNNLLLASGGSNHDATGQSMNPSMINPILSHLQECPPSLPASAQQQSNAFTMRTTTPPSHPPSPLLVRSASEVLAVEGTSLKLNLVITGNQRPLATTRSSGTTSNSASASNQPLARLRLHWQRDNQLISDLNLARGRFSSVQLASESEPDAIRQLLQVSDEQQQQPHNPSVSQQLIFNFTSEWHKRRWKEAQKTITNKVKTNNNNNQDLVDLLDEYYYQNHLGRLSLFRHLVSLSKATSGSIVNANQFLSNNVDTINQLRTSTSSLDDIINYLATDDDDDEVDHTGEDTSARATNQNEAQNMAKGFVLFPSVNSKQLETFQQASSSSLISNSNNQQSIQTRQTIAATLRRTVAAAATSQQQRTSNAKGAANKQQQRQKQLSRLIRDNFLADGQAIDWPTLGLYLQAQSVLNPISAQRKQRLPESVEHQLDMCQQQVGDLDQLIIIQFEINQLRLEDRGQYQLYVCQQSSQVSTSSARMTPSGGGDAGACLQNQLVATISLYVIEDVPRLESVFEPQLLAQGERFSIKCEATGFTLPQISWYLDGQLLSEHHGSQVQTLGSRSHSSTSSLPESQEEDLLLTDSSSHYKRAPSQSSSSSSLSSVISSSQFFRIGDYVSQDNHVHSFVNSSAIRLADGGHYKCQANNGFHAVEHEARIDVQGPVNIERQLAYNASSLIGPNSHWHVQCPYSGYPVGSIEWYFKGAAGLAAKSSHASHALGLAQDYQAEQSGRALRSARESRRKKRRPVEESTMGPFNIDGGENDADTSFVIANAPGASEEQREYVPMNDDAPQLLQQQQDPPDPDKDEWLSQASSMTMSPNGEDYPESLPDYPVPVLQRGSVGGGGIDDQVILSGQQSDNNNNNRNQMPRIPTSQQVLDGDEFELSADEESLSPSASAPLSPDYGDIEMSDQQQQQQQLVRRRRSSSSAQDDWVKLPQSRRHQVHPNGTLAIHDIQQVDQGHYKCHVVAPGVRGGQALHSDSPSSTGQVQQQSMHQLNTWSNELYLSVLVPPVISPFGSSESLREGMRNFLTCSVIEGDSPVRLSWLKDNFPIEDHIVRLEQQARLEQLSAVGNSNSSSFSSSSSQKRIKVETSNEYTSSLYFSHVDFRDNGNYTCIATNKAASVNYTAKMVVNVPPKWTKNPKDVECVAGQNIVIDCQAEAHPSPRVWWEIGVVTPAHQVDKVHVQEEAAKVSSSQQQQQQSSRSSGSSPELAAASQHVQQQKQLQHHHEQPPNHYRTIISNSRIHILENASLVIRDVSRQDQGYYLCQAANNFGSLSALIKLTVNVGASFSSKYSMKYVKLNERVELDCDPSGQAPVTVTWFMRQQQQQPFQLQSAHASANQLNSSGGGGEGAMFSAGPLGNNQSLSNYHHQQQQQRQAASADQLSLQEFEPTQPASATGHRRRLFAGTIQTELPLSQQQATTTSSSSSGGGGGGLANNNLSPHNLADANPEAAFNQQQPQPQQKLIEIDSTMSFEVLKLRNLASGGATAGSNAEIVRLHIKQARRSSSGEYICQAANQFGSDEKAIRLLVQEPPDPVQEISALQLDSRSISIAWLAPFTGNSPITSYTVEWAPIGGGGGGGGSSSSESSSTLDSQQQQQQQQAGSEQTAGQTGTRWSQLVVQQPAASLSPLQPMTSYEIRVRAHNAFGSSPASATPTYGQHTSAQPFVVTTSEEAPGAPPGDIKASALSSSSIQVSWLPPPLSAIGGGPSPPLSSQASPGSDGAKQQPQQHSSLSRNTRIANNIKGYYLGYKAANSNDSFIFKTVSVHSSTSAGNSFFELNSGHYSNHSLLSKAHSGGLGGTTESDNFNSRRSRVIVDDLKRATKYQVIVQAYNSAGPGPQSDPIEVRTLLNDPPPAPILRVGHATYTSIELQWSFNAQLGQQMSRDDFTQLSDLQAATKDEISNHDEQVDTFESIKQVAAAHFSSPLVFASPSASSSSTHSDQRDGGQHSQLATSGTDQQASTIVDGYHLYFRRADTAEGALSPAHEWQERRLTKDTHVMSQSSALASNGAANQVGGSQSAPANTKFRSLDYANSTQTLAQKTFRYVLDQLTCGNLYQIYLVAYNSYGSGLPSQIIRAKTRGSLPIAPRSNQQDFVRVNSTLVQLNLSAWSDGGCNLINFEIRYKQLRGGRPEAIDTLRESGVTNSKSTSAATNWLLLSNNISPEQKHIELRDLQPETWYAILVAAESAAGKTDSTHAFMTLDKLGQVPSEALEPLPVSEPESSPNLPASFRTGLAGATGAGGTLRSLLYNLSGGGSGGAVGPNGMAGAVVSPLILSACMCLIIFATCSLFLIRRYNNLAKDNHSIDLSSSHATMTLANGGGGGGGGNTTTSTSDGCGIHGVKSLCADRHFSHRGDNHYGGSNNNALDHYSLDSKLTSGCDLEHTYSGQHNQHLHRAQQQQQQAEHYQHPLGIITDSDQQQQQHRYSMKVSPCKTGTTIVTNSSASTNGSSGAFLLAGGSSGGGGGGAGSGGDSSICETLAYGSTPNSSQQHNSSANGHQLNDSPPLLSNGGDHHQQAAAACDHQFLTAAAAAAAATANSCRHSHIIDPQQQFCVSNCAHGSQQLGKFATLARDTSAGCGAGGGGGGGGHPSGHLVDLNGTSGNLLLASPAIQAQRHSTTASAVSSSFRTLPHSSLRPVSTFLPPNALRDASGCQMTNGTLESLNRFYGGGSSSGCAAGGSGSANQQELQQVQQRQQENLADQQQIYSKLRLLHQQYQAATATGASNYNLALCQQQQPQVFQESATTTNHENVMALNHQVYAGRNGPQLNGLVANLEASAQQQQQHHPNMSNAESSQQPASQAQQAASGTLAEQDDYALPFPPKWV